MSDATITNEVTQQFLRRTPVKLRQFSRLLNDIATQNIDPLRLKALVSQITKTHEACVAQDFDSTTKLLSKLLKQLSISEEALQTQRPLLKRLSLRLKQHSETFDLGHQAKKTAALKQNLPETEGLNTNDADESRSSDDDSTQTKESVDTESASEELPVEAKHQVNEVVEDSIAELEINADDENDSELEKYALYLTGSVIIFVSPSGKNYQELGKQFESLGVDVFHTDDMQKARQYAEANPGSVIVALIDYAQTEESLPDDDIENGRTPLVYVSPEDTQLNRIKALRSGGTGFLVEPVSLTALLELIERQYDVHAESPYRILVMEDSKAQAKYYEKVLVKGHFEIRVVNDPSVLLGALRGFDPEVVLIDMQMPNFSGIELTRIIRQMPRYAFLPIIFLSAEENEQKQNQALASGGTGFIVKPVQKSALMFNAELHASRYRSLYPQININPDTGLAFSRYFKQQVSIEAIRMSRSGGNAALAIIQFDQVDELIKEAKFSVINLATQQLSQILKQRLRKTDIIGHIETGQLGIILNSGHKQDWLNIMEEIKLQFSELSFHIQQQKTSFSISIGMSMLAGNEDAHQWFTHSFNQLNQAIENGGDRVQSDQV